ncbi:MAG: hypothetical protein HYY40_11140 [Bacteroidetes bacterium]|nr:hypothetical protein [Bacteroidota bacterium]
MTDIEKCKELLLKVAEIGKQSRQVPPIYEVEPFQYFFSQGLIKYNELDKRDGGCTRREIITRYLLVNAVLDQGPHIPGVRKLLKEVTTDLYRKERRIFHRPLDFFSEMGISIDSILEQHKSVKAIFAENWSKNKKSSAASYNLFFTQSSRGIISTNQVLDYSVHRWGTPLCVPLLLEKDNQKNGKESGQPLIDYLESYSSAETMVQGIKNNNRYGLGSAIGDKAAHLFAKWYVTFFNLSTRKKSDTGWTDISYEVPFDGNVGRVLFRTGFFSEFASLEEYKKWKVIQLNSGKYGKHHIRVTNIRKKKVVDVENNSSLFRDYSDLLVNYLKMGSRPRGMEIQRMPGLILFQLFQQGYKYSIADLDDGLMHIGTTFCHNDKELPNCKECPVNKFCVGYKKKPKLISDYRT